MPVHSLVVILHHALRAGVALLTLLIVGWGVLALWFQAGPAWRFPALLAWCVVGGATVFAPWLRGRAPRLIFAAMAVALVALLAWWQSLTPSHERVWADDVARLLDFELEGDHLTLHNVRNFDWRSETDYVPRWETREYSLSELESADLLLSYWMGPTIAHTLVSFGFADGRQLVFSLEIRKERHESFSAIAGFFRQYETVLIAAEENDIVRVRTNARGETVHLYRLTLGPAALRSALLGYLHEADRIRRTPRFYNSLTSNCTTIIFDLARQLEPGLPLDYRLLLSGYFAEYAHDHQGLTPGVDFPTLQTRGDITANARRFDGPPKGISSAIRQGVPGI